MAARRGNGSNLRQREPVGHDARRGLQIADRLEQRHRHDRGRGRIARPVEPDLLKQQIDLEQVGHRLRHRHDIVGDARRAVTAMCLGSGGDDREFGRGFFRIIGVAAGERARIGEFTTQQGDARRLVERGVVRLHAGDLQQFGDDAFVHRRILAQVERRQVEAERLHRPDQPAERPARLERTALRQAVRERDEIRAEALRIAIGFARQASGPRRGLAGQRQMRRGETRVNPGQGATIGLVAAAGRIIAARIRQRADAGIDGGMFGRDRQFGAQRVHGVHVEDEHRFAGPPQSGAQAVRGDEGIAVAIAADPAAGPQEARHAFSEGAVPALVERRDGGQEDVAQVAERGFHLVGDVQALAAQHAGLPQQRDLPRDRVVDPVAVGRLVRTGILQPHQVRDTVAMIDHALAAHLGRVRGEHGRDERMAEQLQHHVAADPLSLQPSQRGRHVRALFGGDPLAILGQIGEHRKEHEAAHEIERLVERQAGEQHLDRIAVAAVAMPFHRGPADRLRRLEQRLAAVSADHLAQLCAEEADVGVVGDGRQGGGGAGHKRDAALRRKRGQPSQRMRGAPSNVPTGARRAERCASSPSRRGSIPRYVRHRIADHRVGGRGRRAALPVARRAPFRFLFRRDGAVVVEVHLVEALDRAFAPFDLADRAVVIAVELHDPAALARQFVGGQPVVGIAIERTEASLHRTREIDPAGDRGRHEPRRAGIGVRLRDLLLAIAAPGQQRGHRRRHHYRRAHRTSRQASSSTSQ
jgi:hypothetical protein